MSKKIIVTNTHAEPTTTSLNVAEVFDKKHFHVLRDIENLKKEMNPNLDASFKEMFFETVYLDKYGRKKKCYEMTRDGFALLAMGFTGEKPRTFSRSFSFCHFQLFLGQLFSQKR